MVETDIGNRVKMLRTQRNMSQQELSEKLNITRSAVAMIEKGDRKPSIEVLIKLSDIFCVGADYLLSGDQNVTLPWDVTYGTNDISSQNINQLYKQIDDNELLISLFDKTKDLQEEDLEQILKIVDTFNKGDK